VLWEDGAVHDLNDYVVTTDPSFIYLSSAVAINDAGQIAAEADVVDTGIDDERWIALLTPLGATAGIQRPGDCNQDGLSNISDAICLLGHLFLGSPVRLPCGDGTTGDSANVRLLSWGGDPRIDLSDAIGLLRWSFLGGPPHALGVDCTVMEGCADACSPD
jgi:hypothetical protein